METKILLCCINPSVDIHSIDELSIYEIFKQYAIVKNVKIFSRDVLLKVFVEVDDESVDYCIKSVHMQNSALGKLKVYISHKDNITFDKDLKTIISESGHHKTSTSQIESHHHRNSENKSISYKVQQTNEVHNMSKKSNLKFSNVSQSFENLDEIFEDNEYIDYKNIKSVTDFNSRLPDLVKYYPVSLENIHTVKSNISKETESSKVLIVNRINTSQVTCLVLMNLFGCFGNVKKILLNMKGSFALVEMETQEHAQSAIKHLNNILFFGNNIKVMLQI